MRKEFLNSKITAALSRFYSDTATIQVKATTPKNAMGEEPDTWSNVTGLIAMACALAPAERGEVRKADMTIVMASHVISFPAYHAGITEQHRAVVAGVNYNILLVKRDSHTKFTSLMVEVIR